MVVSKPPNEGEDKGGGINKVWGKPVRRQCDDKQKKNRDISII